MKILFFGDISGRPGRQALKQELPGLKAKYQPDLVIANAENSAHGAGITKKNLAELKAAGIDYFTSGDHVWDKPEIEEVLKSEESPLIRPANLNRKLIGSGEKLIEIKGEKILLINLLGRVFIEEPTSNPFHKLEQILEKYQAEKLAAIILDFHAEATSEKKAMGLYADGRLSAVLGTHTHVPTADAKILPQGTAYVSDVGMVGAADSVIGVVKEKVLDHFLKEVPFKLDIPDQGPAEINGVYLEIDPQNRRALKIERINLQTEIKK